MRAFTRLPTVVLTAVPLVVEEAVPEPVLPEQDAYPAYRGLDRTVRARAPRTPIDEYVIAAVVAAGTVLSAPPRASRTR